MRTAALSLVLALVLTTDARGDLLYDFVSGSFSSGSSPHNAGDNITGQFGITGSPSLPYTGPVDSLDLSYNDNDGSADFSLQTPTGIISTNTVTIDASGVVTSWSFNFSDFEDYDSDGTYPLGHFVLGTVWATAVTPDADDEDALVVGSFGRYGAGAWLPTPEPSTFLLATLGLLSLGCRRRQRVRPSNELLG